MSTDAGIKHDDGKLRYDLIPPRALEGLVKVLTFGANKYTSNGWKTVEKERYIAAAMRHFEAYRLGELNDPESGLPHMYHVMCCITFISELDMTKTKQKVIFNSKQLASSDEEQE